MELKPKQIYLQQSKDGNIIYQILELNGCHAKIEFCTVPNKKGRKPEIIKEFYWTTIDSFKNQKDLNEISFAEASKLLTEGL